MPLSDNLQLVSTTVTLNTAQGISLNEIWDAFDHLEAINAPTRAWIEAAEIGDDVDFVRTAGYATVGDGGEAVYERAASEPSHDFKVQSGNGVWFEGMPGPYGLNAKAVGAKGDNGTDDRDALQSAMDTVSALGGGRLFLPAGTYIVGSGGTSIALNPPSAVHIVGAGRGLTVVKLANNSNAHTFSLTSVSNVRFSSLTIDGNRANQTAGHGIRGDGVTNLRIDSDVEIMNAAYYCVGIQAGTNANVYISGTFHDCGADCIDFKNKNSANFNINILHPTCYNWGLDTSVTDQVAIDIRGPAQIYGPTCYGFPTDGNGVRFRGGISTDVHGVGGDRSCLIGGYIQGNGGTSIGVNVGSPFVRVVGTYIRGCLLGIQVNGKKNIISDCTLDANSNTDVRLLYTDSTLNASDTQVSGCVGRYSAGGTGIGVDVYGSVNNATISGGVYEGRATGVRIQAGANDTIVHGVSLAGNTAAISDAGTDTQSGFNRT